MASHAAHAIMAGSVDAAMAGGVDGADSKLSQLQIDDALLEAALDDVLPEVQEVGGGGGQEVPATREGDGEAGVAAPRTKVSIYCRCCKYLAVMGEFAARHAEIGQAARGGGGK